jgi:hypothetical protein
MGSTTTDLAGVEAKDGELHRVTRGRRKLVNLLILGVSATKRADAKYLNNNQEAISTVAQVTVTDFDITASLLLSLDFHSHATLEALQKPPKLATHNDAGHVIFSFCLPNQA